MYYLFINFLIKTRAYNNVITVKCYVSGGQHTRAWCTKPAPFATSKKTHTSQAGNETHKQPDTMRKD